MPPKRTVALHSLLEHLKTLANGSCLSQEDKGFLKTVEWQESIQKDRDHFLALMKAIEADILTYGQWRWQLFQENAPFLQELYTAQDQLQKYIELEMKIKANNEINMFAMILKWLHTPPTPNDEKMLAYAIWPSEESHLKEPFLKFYQDIKTEQRFSQKLWKQHYSLIAEMGIEDELKYYFEVSPGHLVDFIFALIETGFSPATLIRLEENPWKEDALQYQEPFLAFYKKAQTEGLTRQLFEENRSWLEKITQTDFPEIEQSIFVSKSELGTTLEKFIAHEGNGIDDLLTYPWSQEICNLKESVTELYEVIKQEKLLTPDQSAVLETIYSDNPSRLAKIRESLSGKKPADTPIAPQKKKKKKKPKNKSKKGKKEAQDEQEEEKQHSESPSSATEISSPNPEEIDVLEALFYQQFAGLTEEETATLFSVLSYLRLLPLHLPTEETDTDQKTPEIKQPDPDQLAWAKKSALTKLYQFTCAEAGKIFKRLEFTLTNQCIQCQCTNPAHHNAILERFFHGREDLMMALVYKKAEMIKTTSSPAKHIPPPKTPPLVPEYSMPPAPEPAGEIQGRIQISDEYLHSLAHIAVGHLLDINEEPLHEKIIAFMALINQFLFSIFDPAASSESLIRSYTGIDHEQVYHYQKQLYSLDAIFSAAVKFVKMNEQLGAVLKTSLFILLEKEYRQRKITDSDQKTDSYRP